MDSSYTNPYGTQPSIPDGGQENNAWPPVSDPSISAAQQQAGYKQAEYVQPSYEQPTYEQQTNYTPQSGFYDNSHSNAQGDIVIAPSKPAGNLGLKRILILAGAGLAVVVLFVAALMSISSGNQAATEAANTERNEKLAVIEKLYGDYRNFLDSYKAIGSTPAETMQRVLDDTSLFFVMDDITLSMAEIMSEKLEKDFEAVNATDFSLLGDTINTKISQVINNIKTGLEGAKTNLITLRSFYDVFVAPMNELVNTDVTALCSFSVTTSEISDLVVDSFDMDNAVDKYNQAYCAISDELYYDNFNGVFDSPYVRNAKEALMNTLLNTSDHYTNLEQLKQILVDSGSEKLSLKIIKPLPVA